MRAATEYATVLLRLVESESENEQEELVGDNECERRVLQCWKSFSVTAAVDSVVSCWNDVTPATINHAWRNLLEGMPEDRKVTAPGAPQTAEAAVL